jgi:hypothetical protein
MSEWWDPSAELFRDARNAVERSRALRAKVAADRERRQGDRDLREQRLPASVVRVRTDTERRT